MRNVYIIIDYNRSSSNVGVTSAHPDDREAGPDT